MAGKPRGESGASLRITLLGRFSVRDAQQPDPIRMPTRVQHLLAYLLLHPGREFRRAHLAEVLWGSRRQAQSRKHLRQALWALRAGIAEVMPGHDLLRCQGEWVQATPNGAVRIDVAEFESATRFLAPRQTTPLPEELAQTLAAAANLYQGDLLDGWGQEWCLAPREHLQRRFLSVVDVLVLHFEACGDDRRAMGCAARALEVDPARESAHRAVMRMLLRAGDRSGASRQYRNCEAAVREELGVAPDDATKALWEAILKGGHDPERGSSPGG